MGNITYHRYNLREMPGMLGGVGSHEKVVGPTVPPPVSARRQQKSQPFLSTYLEVCSSAASRSLFGES
jgi:hypothetical protein